MPSNDSWIYQGRQEHGWFGDGTSPKDDVSKPPQDGANPLFDPANAAQRVDYAAHGIIMYVPRNERSQWNSAVTESARDNLKTAVAAWYGSAGLSRDAFRARFLDPSTSDQTVDLLRSVARGLVEGRSYEDLSQSGKDLAAAAQQVGVYRWPRFLGDASARAVEAVSRGEVPGVTKVAADTTAEVGFTAIVLGLLIYMLATRHSGTSLPPKVDASPPVMMATPPEDAKDPNGAKAPGKPGAAEGFKDPKRGEKWVRNPNGPGWGWQDAKGDVWVPTGPRKGRAHGGPHWDVQSPGGEYRNEDPVGKVRPGR